MILVVGSIDALKYEICFILASQGISIRALMLNPSNPVVVERLKNYGTTLAFGDLQDPIFLADAYLGVNGVICSLSGLSSDQRYGPDLINGDLIGMMNLIDAAKNADVLRFVYISFSYNQDLNIPFRKGRQVVEQHLIDSGIPYTILYAGDNQAQIPCTCDQVINRISTTDLAWLAVKNLENLPQYDSAVKPVGSLKPVFKQKYNKGNTYPFMYKSC